VSIGLLFAVSDRFSRQVDLTRMMDRAIKEIAK
jgi:hypothetical protein